MMTEHDLWTYQLNFIHLDTFLPRRHMKFCTLAVMKSLLLNEKKSKSCCQRKHHFQWPPLRDWLNTRAILLMCHLWSSDSWNKGSPLFQLAVCKVILVSETRVHLCVWYHPFMDFTLYLKLPRVISTNWIYFADDVQITLPKGVRKKGKNGN